MSVLFTHLVSQYRDPSCVVPRASPSMVVADNETVLTKPTPGSSTASQPVDLDRFVAVAVLSVGVVVLVVSVVQRLCTRSGPSATDELYKVSH